MGSKNIQDWNGTVGSTLPVIQDWNGTVNSKIQSVYDWNGTVNSLIYNAEEQILGNDNCQSLWNLYNQSSYGSVTWDGNAVKHYYPDVTVDGTAYAETKNFYSNYNNLTIKWKRNTYHYYYFYVDLINQSGQVIYTFTLEKGQDSVGQIEKQTTLDIRGFANYKIRLRSQQGTYYGAGYNWFTYLLLY